MKRHALGLTVAALFLLTVVAANWLVENVGVVNVGFGLVAPAGVYVVGVALVLRDAVQRAYGRVATCAVILAGAGLSYLISPTLAFASGVAFLVSEAADMSVFTPMHHHSPLLAVGVSGVVGAAVDSLVFLQLAFGDIGFFPGQFIGKVYMAAAGMVALAAWRWARRPTLDPLGGT